MYKYTVLNEIFVYSTILDELNFRISEQFVIIRMIYECLTTWKNALDIKIYNLLKTNKCQLTIIS